MPTLPVPLDRRTSAWLRRRGRELGMSPEAVAADLLRRQQAADEFRALSERVGAYAAAQGLTPETLAELLDGETFDD